MSALSEAFEAMKKQSETAAGSVKKGENYRYSTFNSE